MSNTKLSRQVSAVALNVVVAAIGILIAYPLVWMVSASFKTITEIYQFPPTLIPNGFTFANYARLFKDWPFGSWYTNSLAIAVIETLTVLFFTSLAGFGFAKYRFRGKNALFFLMLGSTMVPFQLILIPLFIEMSQLKWTNSYLSLIIPFTCCTDVPGIMEQLSVAAGRAAYPREHDAAGRRRQHDWQRDSRQRTAGGCDHGRRDSGHASDHCGVYLGAKAICRGLDGGER